MSTEQQQLKWRKDFVASTRNRRCGVCGTLMHKDTGHRFWTVQSNLACEECDQTVTPLLKPVYDYLDDVQGDKDPKLNRLEAFAVVMATMQATLIDPTMTFKQSIERYGPYEFTQCANAAVHRLRKLNEFAIEHHKNKPPQPFIELPNGKRRLNSKWMWHKIETEGIPVRRNPKRRRGHGRGEA